MASISKASNVNLLSNQDEKLSEIQQKIREQAKKELFQTLVLDKRDFIGISGTAETSGTAENIKNLENNKDEKIKIGKNEYNFDDLIKKPSYKEVYEKYKDSGDAGKEKMYIEISERVILDKLGVVTYKDKENIGNYTIDADFVKKEYETLNTDSKYKGKLDFFTVTDPDGKLYIIKRTDSEKEKILQKENDIMIGIIENRDEQIAKFKEQLGIKVEGGEGKNKARTTEIDENQDNHGYLTRKEFEERINNNLKYAGFDENYNKVKDSSREKNRESLEKNPLYVSRNDLENSVLACRKNSDFPIGNVEIKGTYVKLEEFDFYEEIKQEYILARGDIIKLAELDKKLAELIILSSPKGADVEHRYQIQLTEEEVNAGGLVVSKEFLAKYGLDVYYFEYTNTIIEREYQERIETIRTIEREMTDLTTIITELTTKVNIEKFSSENSLKELREKKDRLRVLLNEQKKLLKTLRKGKRITKIVDDDEHKDGEEVFNFLDDTGNIFWSECNVRGIKRRDGQKIPEKGGINIYEEYVDSKGRILRLEPNSGGSDGRYDDGPKEGYKFVYTGKKLTTETIYGKRRISLGRFPGGEGNLFKHYCDENGITRKDGVEISGTKLNDDFMDVPYVDKYGRELKLEFAEGGSKGGDDNTLNEYEFVYYEGEKERDGDEVGNKLNDIINEQEALLIELEELEEKLKRETSESIKVNIEKEITRIQQKLFIIKQNITEITNSTKLYKETIREDRYRVYRARPIPVPDWKESFEMTAVLSDMGTDVFREKASLKVEEDLKAYYKSLGPWQVGSRLALFLGRGRRRKRMINREMNNMANTAFQRGVGYDTLNDQSQNAADRHKHELDNNMEAIDQIARVHNDDVDQLCKDYLNSGITDDQFQDQFNQIIANDANIQNILNGQNITHIGTNILLRLQEQKALNQLILNMDAQLAQYVTTGSQVNIDNMRNFVSQYIKDYQKTPAFMATFEQFLNGGLNAKNNLKQCLIHQQQVMQMQITNLRMNIDILNKGKSAYQIDNKDRETGKGSWKYKLGHFMDKHPRGTAIASTAISVGIGLGTGLIASPVVAGWASLGLFGALVGTTNAVKKWTHHTKEQNTHEKNVATDYRNEQAKIQAWQNQALNGHGWRKYKAKRQLALYDQTTQENIQLSDQITEYITNLSSKVGTLTADEDNFMRCNLIEGWARLKYYRQMGHNFLASEQVDSTEKDMKRLEKAITLGLEKLGTTIGRTLTTNDIEQNMTATNQLGTNITYAVIQNDLKASYDKSLIQFKRERRNLSLKYGIGTALASIGVGAFFQWITGTGIAGGHDIAPSTTTTTQTGSENFVLSGSELTGTSSGTIEEASKNAFSSATNGDTVNILYGIGTDGTKLKPGAVFDVATKKTDVIDHINGLSGLSSANKTQFIDYINSMPTLSNGATLPSQGLLDGNLATMRQYETLERIADGLAASGNGGKSLTLSFSPIGYTGTNTTAGAIAGVTPHTAAERFATGIIEVGHTDPGKKVARRGRWFMGLPLFFNTFKDRKETTDTTDQNFGRGNNQQQNRPNNQQQNRPNNQQPNRPQPNPNQPNNP